MLDLKEWQKWFENKGYNSTLYESDSENSFDELTIQVTNNVYVSITSDGRVFVQGMLRTESKTNLWNLINTIGVIQ